MSYDRILETISSEHQNIDISELVSGSAAVVSKNARKHCVTAELEPRSVRDWYCIIVNGPTSDLPLLENINVMQQCALNLAQAEVGLRRVLETISEFKQERDPLFEQ